MKIPTTQPSAQTHAATDANRTSARRDAGGEKEAEAPHAPGAGAGRDFASVLEEVARPRERQSREDEGEGESLDAKTSERADAEPETQRREGRERDGGEGGDSRGGGFEQRGGVREAATAQEGTAAARAILHIADLERVVSAVRAQTLAGGAREITLELRRSVLEGLRIKLRMDGAGRVAAEFVAGSERVRAQLDARASELAELFRARGVNLASLRASVGSDASPGRDSQSAGHDFVPLAGAAQSSTTANSETEDASAHDADSAGTTYRA